jgi:hypothetical protein
MTSSPQSSTGGDTLCDGYKKAVWLVFGGLGGASHAHSRRHDRLAAPHEKLLASRDVELAQHARFTFVYGAPAHILPEDVLAQLAPKEAMVLDMFADEKKRALAATIDASVHTRLTFQHA